MGKTIINHPLGTGSYHLYKWSLYSSKPWLPSTKNLIEQCSDWWSYGVILYYPIHWGLSWATMWNPTKKPVSGCRRGRQRVVNNRLVWGAHYGLSVGKTGMYQVLGYCGMVMGQNRASIPMFDANNDHNLRSAWGQRMSLVIINSHMPHINHHHYMHRKAIHIP